MGCDLNLRNFRTERPDAGTKVLAFSPVYKRGDPMRWRFVQVLPVGMDEVVAYMLMDDLEDKAIVDGLFAGR